MIVDYQTEEFTHQAVAAVIASGAADVGIGVRAAAANFFLNRMALGEESYYRAVRHARADEPPLAALDAAAARTAAHTPGYRAAG